MDELEAVLLLVSNMKPPVSVTSDPDGLVSVRDANICVTRVEDSFEHLFFIDRMGAWINRNKDKVDLPEEDDDGRRPASYGEFMFGYLPTDEEDPYEEEVIKSVFIPGITADNAQDLLNRGILTHIVNKIIKGDRGFNAQDAEKELRMKVYTALDREPE